ncbi:unnamed protein product, partial [Brassica rapa]
CRLVLIQLAVTLKLRYICFYCSIECQSSDSFSCVRVKNSLLYEGVSTVPLNALPDFSTIQLAVTFKLRYICFYCSIECQSGDSSYLCE